MLDKRLFTHSDVEKKKKKKKKRTKKTKNHQDTVVSTFDLPKPTLRALMLRVWLSFLTKFCS